MIRYKTSMLVLLVVLAVSVVAWSTPPPIPVNFNGFVTDASGPVAGITIKLYTESGQFISQTTTNEIGYYFGLLADWDDPDSIGVEGVDIEGGIVRMVVVERDMVQTPSIAIRISDAAKSIEINITVKLPKSTDNTGGESGGSSGSSGGSSGGNGGWPSVPTDEPIDLPTPIKDIEEVHPIFPPEDIPADMPVVQRRESVEEPGSVREDSRQNWLIIALVILCGITLLLNIYKRIKDGKNQD